MGNPFIFEAEPFEYQGFDEVYESDFWGEPFEIDPEFGSEFNTGYSDPESFELWKLPICKAGKNDIYKLREIKSKLDSSYENGNNYYVEIYAGQLLGQIKLINARLKKGWYKKKGCKQKDLTKIESLKTG